MSNRGQFRPTPLDKADALPGHRSATWHFEVGCGLDCVGLWSSAESVGWVFSADEARRLGMRLMAMADQAEEL